MRKFFVLLVAIIGIFGWGAFTSYGREYDKGFLEAVKDFNVQVFDVNTWAEKNGMQGHCYVAMPDEVRHEKTIVIDGGKYRLEIGLRNGGYELYEVTPPSFLFFGGESRCIDGGDNPGLSPDMICCTYDGGYCKVSADIPDIIQKTYDGLGEYFA